MINVIFDREIAKILTIFSVSQGSRMQRKEIQERARINNRVLDSRINLLLNAKILKKEKRLLSLDLEKEIVKNIVSILAAEYKNLKELPLDAYFSILEVIDFLGRFKSLQSYLFGSYAKLIYKEKSDIDLAIISDRISEKDKKGLGNLTRKVESKYKTSIEIHYFTGNFYKNKKDPLVKEILKNGVKLI
ncbi:MAG: nucleotidyltransferase domain-containing protein [archaeon]